MKYYTRREAMVQSACAVLLAQSGVGIHSQSSGLLVYEESLDILGGQRRDAERSGLDVLNVREGDKAVIERVNALLDVDSVTLCGLTSASWRFIVGELVQRRGYVLTGDVGKYWRMEKSI